MDSFEKILERKREQIRVVMGLPIDWETLESYSSFPYQDLKSSIEEMATYQAQVEFQAQQRPTAHPKRIIRNHYSKRGNYHG